MKLLEHLFVVASRRAYFFIFLTALAIRMVNAVFMSGESEWAMLEDADHYWRGAQAWIDKGPMTHMSVPGVYMPQTERVPLYHIFLIPFRWLFGDSVLPALMGQALVDAGTCVVITALGAMLGPSVGIVAGLLAAIWPNLIVHSGMILGDTLFVFLISLLLLYSAKFLIHCRVSDLAVAGLICGLAIMTRPIAFFLPISMAVVALFVPIIHKRNCRMAVVMPVIFLAVSLLPSLPLAVRNLTQFDSLQLTSQGGAHLLNWVVGLSRAQLEGRTFEDVSNELSLEFDFRMKENATDITQLNPFEKSRLLTSFALEKLQEIPLYDLVKVWLQNGAINLAVPAILGDPRIRRMQGTSYLATTGDNLLERIVNFLGGNPSAYMALFLGGAAIAVIAFVLQIGGYVLLLKHSPWAGFFAGLVLLYFLLANGPIFLPKYRLPMEPVLIVLQALAVVSVWRFLCRARSSAMTV